MLKLALRAEFKGERLKGTTIDFSADKRTGALTKSSDEFLSITYPSVDLLKVFEATQPDRHVLVQLVSGEEFPMRKIDSRLYWLLNRPKRNRNLKGSI